MALLAVLVAALACVDLTPPWQRGKVMPAADANAAASGDDIATTTGTEPLDMPDASQEDEPDALAPMDHGGESAIEALEVEDAAPADCPLDGGGEPWDWAALDGGPDQGGEAGTAGVGGDGNPNGQGGAAGSPTSDAGGATGTGGGMGGSGGAVGTALVKLTGTAFGTGPPLNNDPAFAFGKVFDGDITTWDDDQTASSGYAGIDLGIPVSVSVIRYYPRAKWNTRMVGGKFQCSTTSPTAGYTNLHTVTAEPPLAWVEIGLLSPATCRYLRYLGPTNGKTNIAEVEFWGPAPGSGSGPADAGAPLTNLSSGKPAMASSESADSQAPSAANDGLLTSKFCSADSTFPVWWMVDLGAVYPIVQTDINSDNAASAYQYRIEVSSDASTWTTAVDQTASTTRTGGTLTDDFQAEGRYVRLTITNVLTTNGPGCFLEFLVWGYNTPRGTGTSLSDLSRGMPATASLPQSTNKPPSNGNDGIATTPFCSGNAAYPVWWRVDLGTSHHLAMTEILFERTTGRYRYVIEVSEDDVAWGTVVDQSTNTTRYGARVNHALNVSGRYVRITLLGVSTGDWGCFYELTVRGT